MQSGFQLAANKEDSKSNIMLASFPGGRLAHVIPFPGNFCVCLVKCPWAEHLTSPSKRGVGALSNVSAFNHKRVPMSCLQQLDAVEANNIIMGALSRDYSTSFK